MVDQPLPEDPAKDEKKEDGSSFLNTATSLFPYPMRWAGSFIFIVASVASILFLFIGGFSVESDGGFEYSHFHTIEMLLKVAAVALVLAALSGERNGLVVVIGLLLVGALIVPTKDMMRIYLAATNSERQLDDFYGDSGGGPELRGRDYQLASTIVDVLEQAGLVVEDSASDLSRADMYWLVEEEIVHERVTTLLERTRSRGALELLARIHAGQVAQASYRYGSDDRHISTIQFLRNASLISYIYDDLDSIEVTALGVRILQRAVEDGFSAPGLGTTDLNLMEGCIPLSQAATAPEFRIGDNFADFGDESPYQKRPFRLGRSPSYARLSVDASDQEVAIWATAVRGISGVKASEEEHVPTTSVPVTFPRPLIEIYKVAAVGGDCEFVAVSSIGDVAGDGSNRLDFTPTLRATLSEGDYAIVLTDRTRTRGLLDLEIAQPGYNPNPSNLLIDRRSFDLWDPPFDNWAECDGSFQVGNTTENLNLVEEPAYRVLSGLAAGTYELELNSVPDGGDVDPVMAYQAARSTEDCSPDSWVYDDDGGALPLNSRGTVVVQQGEVLLVAGRAYDSNSGVAQFLARRNDEGPELP